MSHCKACRPITKGDIYNPEIHLGTCQECGRNHRVILTEYYNNIPKTRVKSKNGCRWTYRYI